MMSKAILSFAVSLLLASVAPAGACPTNANPAPILHFHGTNCSSDASPIGACGLAGVTFSLETSPGGPAIVHVRTTFAPSTVDYFTDDYGRGYSGTRYTPVSGTVSFAAGEYDKTVSIPILDNSVADGDAAFNLQLKNPTNGVTLAESG